MSKKRIQELIPNKDDDFGIPRQARLDSNSQLLTYSRNERETSDSFLVCVTSEGWRHIYTSLKSVLGRLLQVHAVAYLACTSRKTRAREAAMWGSTTSPRPTGLGMWLFGHRLLLNVPDLLLMSVKGGLSLKHVVLRPGGLKEARRPSPGAFRPFVSPKLHINTWDYSREVDHRTFA